MPSLPQLHPHISQALREQTRQTLRLLLPPSHPTVAKTVLTSKPTSTNLKRIQPFELDT